LGDLYDRGRGVAQNHKAAVKWYRLAAKQGHAPAQTSLAVMYGKGQGVRQDYKAAVKWYRLAAEQGYIAAQASLGVMYGTGQGVMQDNLYAHMWGDIAASSGNEGGRKLLDLIVNQMTPEQISQAQQLAQRCIQKKFKGC
jgi:TPR repeat protein